jgi:hypothetical protein
MSEFAAQALLAAAAGYAAIGLVVGAPFVTIGIARVDPGARGTPWTFRALILPGVIALWPIVLRAWLRARTSR